MKKLIFITLVLCSKSLWAEDGIYLSCEIKDTATTLNQFHGDRMWISVFKTSGKFNIFSKKRIEERGDSAPLEFELEVSGNFYKAKILDNKLNRTTLKYGDQLYGSDYALCSVVTKTFFNSQISNYLYRFKKRREI